MDDLLYHLEQQIRSLIDQHDGLKQYNQQLQHNKAMLAHKYEALLVKQQKAITQIETLVSKLKPFLEKTA